VLFGKWYTLQVFALGSDLALMVCFMTSLMAYGICSPQQGQEIIVPPQKASSDLKPSSPNEKTLWHLPHSIKNIIYHLHSP